MFLIHINHLIWAADKIIIKRNINFSILVGKEDSIFAPVIKDVDQKNNRSKVIDQRQLASCRRLEGVANYRITLMKENPSMETTTQQGSQLAA